jgi:hypothetical protein
MHIQYLNYVIIVSLISKLIIYGIFDFFCLMPQEKLLTCTFTTLLSVDERVLILVDLQPYT